MKHRLMIVDDDLAILESMMDGLYHDFEIIGATNGMDCLEKLDSYEPDLIVLDIMMPGVDGLGACRAIRKNARFSQIPIFFVSGQDNPEINAAVREFDIVFFLRKPLTPSDLMQSLKQYIADNRLNPQPKSRTMKDIKEEEERSSEETPHRPLVRLAMSSNTPTLNESRSDLDPTEPSAAGENGRRPRIVVVDDDVTIVNYVLQILQDNYETIGLNNPVTAVERMQRYQPDVVILDVKMPGLSGYQISQLIRIKPLLRNVKILFATSCDNHAEIEYGKQLGAAGYLPKPFTPTQLIRKITALLSLPDFEIQPKRLSISEIKQMEVDALV